MDQKKVNVAIIGTGNIGTDLLLKINRSAYLKCVLFTGQNTDSKGIALAKQLNIQTSTESINAVVKQAKNIDIVFDATNAQSHKIHAPILKKLNLFTIDLTPSRIGKMCIPVLNLKDCLKGKNVNMITCGGQAMVPLAFAITSVHPDTSYIEIVGSISSKSAGIGTRNNIDEYTQATKDSLKSFSKVKNSKAIIILNPAEPPINMHNTLYAEIEKPNLRKINEAVEKMALEVAKYVPGYKVILSPIFKNNRIILMVEVIGAGDFLPKYAGNLDIINSAAINLAEEYASKKLKRFSSN